jgi:hypothetical protein
VLVIVAAASVMLQSSSGEANDVEVARDRPASATPVSDEKTDADPSPRSPVLPSDEVGNLTVAASRSEAASDLLRCGEPSSEMTSANGGPVSVIFDTDFGPDVDDVGALAILHALADRGETEILGVMVSASGDPDGPRAVDVVNTYYGRPDIPIGLADASAPSFPSTYTAEIASSFANEQVPNPTATSLYRQLLATQPDRSVTIVSVGFTSNLDDLLLSGPDEHSPLNGADLVAEKVKLWVAMAGQFPNSDENPWGGEWNLVNDLRASIITTAIWPTPVVFSGFEVGSAIMTGGVLQTAVPEDNPVREAYRLFTGGSDRQSWDLSAVWYAVRGADGLFDTCSGRIEIHGDGSNDWAAAASGHAFLRMTVEADLIAETFDELLVTPPAHQAAANNVAVPADSAVQASG